MVKVMNFLNKRVAYIILFILGLVVPVLFLFFLSDSNLKSTRLNNIGKYSAKAPPESKSMAYLKKIIANLDTKNTRKNSSSKTRQVISTPPIYKKIILTALDVGSGNKDVGIIMYGGGEEAHIAGPTSITLDYKGNIYLLDAVNNRIKKFLSNGRFLRNIPISEFQLRKLFSRDFPNNGYNYILDYVNERKSRLTIKNKLSKSVVTSFLIDLTMPAQVVKVTNDEIIIIGSIEKTVGDSANALTERENFEKQKSESIYTIQIYSKKGKLLTEIMPFLNSRYKEVWWENEFDITIDDNKNIYLCAMSKKLFFQNDPNPLIGKKLFAIMKFIRQ